MKVPFCGNRSYFGNLAGSLFIVFMLDETLLFHGAAAPAGLASAMAVSVAKVAVPHTPHTCLKKSCLLVWLCSSLLLSSPTWQGSACHVHAITLARHFMFHPY